MEFGVLRRDVAVGGQMLDLQGLGGDYEEVFLPLHGAHQAHNAACALAATEAFLGGGREQVDVDVIRRAFADVTSPGRLEVVRRSPTVLLDAAHNPAGAAATSAAIQDAFTFTRLVGVLAVLAGKDSRGILEALEPVLAEVVVTQNSSPRTLSADDLAAVAVETFGADRVEVVPRMDDAFDSAVALAEEEGDLGGAGVLVTGSIVTVGDARTLLRRVARCTHSHRPYSPILLCQRSRPRGVRRLVRLPGGVDVVRRRSRRSSRCRRRSRRCLPRHGRTVRHRWAYVVGSVLQVALDSLRLRCPDDVLSRRDLSDAVGRCLAIRRPPRRGEGRPRRMRANGEPDSIESRTTLSVGVSSVRE